MDSYSLLTSYINTHGLWGYRQIWSVQKMSKRRNISERSEDNENIAAIKLPVNMKTVYFHVVNNTQREYKRDVAYKYVS